MSARSKRLSAAFVAGVKAPGKYYDQFGLVLLVRKSGRRYWWQRVTIRGTARRRDLGLGSYPLVTLSEARGLAFDNFRLASKGIDPLLERRRKAPPTLAEAIPPAMRERAKSWSDERTFVNHIRALERYVAPTLGCFPVSEITVRMIKKQLLDVAEQHPTLARQLRTDLRYVMDWAITEGYRTDNPAGNDLNSVFVGVAGGAKTRHARAIEYRDIGHGWVLVECVSHDRVLPLWWQLIVLTAVRGIEACRATWDEFDIESAMWNVPEEHMKARRPHWVPLSAPAVEVLKEVRESLPRNESGHLFVSEGTGKPYSTTHLAAKLKNTGLPATPHGMRSTFGDWTEETGVPLNVAELCLSHAHLTKLQRSYRRTALLDQRRVVMEDWGAYVMERVVEARADVASNPFMRKVEGPGIGTGRSRRNADPAVIEKLIADGLNVTDIARKLDIPRQTVYRVKDKLRDLG